MTRTLDFESACQSAGGPPIGGLKELNEKIRKADWREKFDKFWFEKLDGRNSIGSEPIKFFIACEIAEAEKRGMKKMLKIIAADEGWEESYQFYQDKYLK